MAFTIDVNENEWSREIIKILLIDRTTGRNIIWGTYDYEHLGSEYNSHYPILDHLITGNNSNLIKPRVLKSKGKQEIRTKEKAEVFTPSFICNAQNNLIDNAWFERKNVFNVEVGKRWFANKGKIDFLNSKSKSWKDYIDERRMEFTCGEAPYLVSRYDTVTGEIIDLYERIGLLDRKMRVIAENTESEAEWLKWAERAFQSVYGFEFQGDSLLIARENLLVSYCDYMKDKLDRSPTYKELIKIANIISWNLWQMDGLTYTIPFETKSKQSKQMSFFHCFEEEEKVVCFIRDWRARENITFESLIKRES